VKLDGALDAEGFDGVRDLRAVRDVGQHAEVAAFDVGFDQVVGLIRGYPHCYRFIDEPSQARIGVRVAIVQVNAVALHLGGHAHHGGVKHVLMNRPEALGIGQQMMPSLPRAHLERGMDVGVVLGHVLRHQPRQDGPRDGARARGRQPVDLVGEAVEALDKAILDGLEEALDLAIGTRRFGGDFVANDIQAQQAVGIILGFKYTAIVRLNAIGFSKVRKRGVVLGQDRHAQGQEKISPVGLVTEQTPAHDHAGRLVHENDDEWLE